MQGREFPPSAGDGSATGPADLTVSGGFSFTEDVIERFVRYPETLSEEIRSAVHRYVIDNPVGAGIAEFYRRFYEDLGAVSACSDARVERFIRSLSPLPAPPISPSEPELPAGIPE